MSAKMVGQGVHERLEAGAYMCKSILRLGIRRNRRSCSRYNHLKRDQVSESLSGAIVL